MSICTPMRCLPVLRLGVAVCLAMLAIPVAALAAVAAEPAAVSPPAAAAPQKVFRYAMRIAETGFDPAQISDLYSSTLAANIFDALYATEFLARPVRLKPNTATAMPEISADFTTFTVRVRPGIYFTDDPAFNGKPRELTAADYVYSIKRHFDPRWKSPRLSTLENHKILGIDALRDAAVKGKKPFDYDREIEGLRTLDRYTIRFRLGQPNPRFTDDIADPAVTGAVAREVVEAYGDRIMEHPVGTGPYKLGAWARSSRISFDRNPNYRDEFYAEDAPADDPLAQAAVARLKGRKLPMIDRIEVSVIEQSQPRWLAFVNREMEMIEQVPEDFTYVAIPNNRIAPNLAKLGIYDVRYLRNDASMSYFAMENPVVGGYTPAKVALRRAIALAVNVDEEIRAVRRGQAIVAQSVIGPGTWGYDRKFRAARNSRSKAAKLEKSRGFS